MPRRVSHLRVALLAFVVLLCGVPAARAAQNKIKPGDKVKVIRGPAPVKVGKKTLTTVEAGTVLTALKVQGNWVKVTVKEDGGTIEGWVHSLHLGPTRPKRGAMSEGSAKKKPATQSRSEAAPPSSVPLTLEQSRVLDRAMKAALGLHEPRVDAHDAIVDKQYCRHATVTLDLSGDRVECLRVNKKLTARVVYRRGRPTGATVNLVGTMLAFPCSFSLGAVGFPPRTVLRRRTSTWERITTPNAFRKILGKVAEALFHGKANDRLVAARTLGHLGPAARPVVPALIRALKYRRQWVVESFVEALEKITGEDFGKDRARWQQWWEENKGKSYEGRPEANEQ